MLVGELDGADVSEHRGVSATMRAAAHPGGGGGWLAGWWVGWLTGWMDGWLKPWPYSPRICVRLL